VNTGNAESKAFAKFFEIYQHPGPIV